ncbi:MAG: 5-formyltetrahydrofolate cyclo-ligase [bacterium]
MTKDEIRQQMRDARSKITPEERKTLGQEVCKNVLDEPIRLLLRAWRVCIYLSTRNEIPTRYVARAVWDAGREVCVPVWSQSNEKYKLSAMNAHTRLITGHHGIREPAVRIPVMPWDVDAFILPGLAFDKYGGRLGYGAGHYDHILGKAARIAPKIALCYDWQVLDEPVPQEPHDIPMDWIVTDTRVIDCAANRKMSRAESGSRVQSVPGSESSPLNPNASAADVAQAKT